MGGVEIVLFILIVCTFLACVTCPIWTSLYKQHKREREPISVDMCQRCGFNEAEVYRIDLNLHLCLSCEEEEE